MPPFAQQSSLPLYSPPEGRRSYGPHRAAFGGAASPAEWTRAQNEHTQTWAMVETSAALDDLDGILAVPGLTGIFIGPNDLGLALGYAPTSAPDGPLLGTIESVLDRAHAAGKRAGIYCAEAEACRRMARRGFDLVSVGGDLGWLRGAASAALARARGSDEGKGVLY